MNKVVKRHLLVGWWGLVIYLTMGLVLETLHGLKVAYYLDVGNETRRLMWTLAHAHGALLSLVNIALAATIPLVSDSSSPTDFPPSASWALIAGWILLPLGFFLGGLQIYGGDPGLGVILAPIGAALLVGAASITALHFYYRIV